MKANGWKFELDETRDGVTIVLGRKRVHLTTRDLEIAIARLGAIPTQLQPQVPLDVGLSLEIHTTANLRPVPTPTGQTAEPDPAWTLLFRSTHFGWFRLMLSRANATDLGTLLQSDPGAVPKQRTH